MATAAAPVAAPSDRPASEVKAVLADGRKDLWNVEFPGLLGYLYSPIRSCIFDPSFAFASIVLPPIFSVHPKADHITAKIIFFFLTPTRTLHGWLAPNVDEMDLRRNARNDLIVNSKAALKMPHFQPPSDFLSAVRGAFAFCCSVTADVVGAIMDRKKMTKWFECLTEFKSYLDASGVGAELEEAIQKPLLRGRLLDNVKILNDIQEKLYHDRCEDLKKKPAENIGDSLIEGKRMMRFATAAYGTEMIRSALDKQASAKELENQRKAIAFHSDIAEDDIRILSVEDGGSMMSLRHFVAVDHKTKSVVIALRGTLSISGALVDMTAMDADFCCGKAHKGMCEMADNIWKESGDKIVQLFEEPELKEYTFVITGHSLGAGTACLLNIKCHVEKPLGNRKVRCFGFAAPPTYCLSQDERNKPEIQNAIKNCICYIHDNDCVPLLSVLSIRRLALLMDAVDNQTEFMWAYRRFKIFWEWEEIPQSLYDSVESVDRDEQTRNADTVHGASRLAIPARMVVWMKKNFAGSFEDIVCSPNDISAMNIFCCEDMITDHLPEQYEDALDALTEE